MSSFFCGTPNLDAVIKDSAYLAGFAVASNNTELAKSILPVAQATMITIDGGSDNAALNALFQAKLTALIAATSTNPIITLAINLVLNKIGFNPQLPSVTVFSNAMMKELVDSFVAGVTAVIPK
jgi:hypothetical protein